MKPITYSSYGGYRRFCVGWWKEVWRYATTGWLDDLKTFWHRGRYGWAPRDTWSLDVYLCHVYAQSLAHLADHTHGTPFGYPNPNPDETTPTDHEQWRADLHSWAKTFSDVADSDDPWATPNRVALHQTLRDMEPWFESLWD